MVEAVFAAAIGTAFLFLFYAALRSDWPASYVTFESLTDPVIAQSGLKYLAYRLLPYLTVSSFVASALDKRSISPVIPALAPPVIHAMATSGRILVRDGVRIIGARNRDRLGHTILQLATALSAPAMGVLAINLRHLTDPLFPDATELSVTVWTGAFAAILGAFVLNVLAREPFSVDQLVEREERLLGPALLRAADRAAESNGTSKVLMRSVLLVESAQRPRWVRWIERRFSFVLGNGTYGVMQVTAPRAIGDEESIEIAAERHLKGMALPLASYDGTEVTEAQLDEFTVGHVDSDRLHEALRPYNVRRSYAELVAEVAEHLMNRDLMASPLQPPATPSDADLPTAGVSPATSDALRAVADRLVAAGPELERHNEVALRDLSDKSLLDRLCNRVQPLLDALTEEVAKRPGLVADAFSYGPPASVRTAIPEGAIQSQRGMTVRCSSGGYPAWTIGLIIARSGLGRVTCAAYSTLFTSMPLSILGDKPESTDSDVRWSEVVPDLDLGSAVGECEPVVDRLLEGITSRLLPDLNYLLEQSAASLPDE